MDRKERNPNITAQFLGKRSAPSKPSGSGATAQHADLLVLMENEGGAITMRQLIDRSGLSPIDAVRAVEALQRDEFCAVEQVDGDDVVTITSLGRRVAKYAAPL